MATQCFTPLFGRMIRVTALDECGEYPIDGTPCASVTTRGFTTVSLTSETEDGTEIVVKRADGSICVNERANNSFKRFMADITFCGVDPDLLSFLTNAEQYEDYAGDVIGITVPEGEIAKRFALELWMGLTGQACAPGSQTAGAYLLLPFMCSGILGDLEVTGESQIDFSMTGAYSMGGNGWGVGPYDVILNDDATPVADVLPTALDPLDHLLLIQSGVTAPIEACGCQSMNADAATGATAGIPGTWTPPGSIAPASVSNLQAGTPVTVVASPLTAWTTGQYVQTQTAGAPGQAHWDGDSWESGVA